jgi:hypothetical protein
MKTIEFEGVEHEFPDDATDDEIRQALNAMHPAPAAFSAPGHGMGDVKMAESQPAQSVRDPWTPGRAQLEADALAKGEKVNPVLGALTTVSDLANIPSRAAAKFRGEDMADPNAYFLRPEVEALKADTTGQDADAQRILNQDPTLTGQMPPGIPSPMGLKYAGLPSTRNAALEGVGPAASDPLMVLSIGGKVVAGLTKKGMEALHAAIPGMKNYISGLSQVNQPLLEKAATDAGMATLKEGARMAPEDLAQAVATDAGKVNKYREDLAANSRTTQQQQIQSINDDLALENQKVNTQVGQEAEGRNDYLQQLADKSREVQQQQAEANILDARRQATGADDASLRDIKPGALGEDIKQEIMGGKGDMQDAWVQGDQKSVGPYRDAAAADETNPKSARYGLKMLTGKIADIQEKYKALEPNAGMRKISEGAAAALSDLSGFAEHSGHTVDDLLNIKAELRRIRGMDRYKGIPFDNTTDDIALNDVAQAVDQTLAASLKKAAPKQAGDILQLMRAKDQGYAIAKNYLGDLAKGMGQTPNSAAIIQKVKNLGPQKAREFITAAANESRPGGRGPEAAPGVRRRSDPHLDEGRAIRPERLRTQVDASVPAGNENRLAGARRPEKGG